MDFKYSIETTENGCVETLTFNDDVLGPQVLTRTHTIIDDSTTECKDATFANTLRNMGYNDEIVEAATTCFDTMFAHHLLLLKQETI